MKLRVVPRVLALLLAAALVACDQDASVPPTVSTDRGNPAAVLGGNGGGPRAVASGPLTDASGRPIPMPALPRGARAQLVRSAGETALAVWEQDGNVVAASYAPASGWSAPQPLEDIYGQASDPQLASNGRGVAMALWRHTVGNIESLRFSRFELASGWSVPDVMPGALPRPRDARVSTAPELHMDAQGNGFAQWASGFDANEVQTARYVAGHGWTRALSEPATASAPAASGPETRTP